MVCWWCRKDSLLTHRAFCDALAEESARLLAAAAASNGGSATTTTNSSNGGNTSSDLLFSSSIATPLFLPFPNPPPPAAAAQNPNALYFLHQEQAQQQLLAPFLQPRMVQPSPYLLDLHADAATIATAGGGGIVVAADAVNFGGLAPDGSVALRGGGHRRLTRDFLGVDGGGQVEELQLPLYATTAAAAAVPRAASCATDITSRQCLGERLPPVNETWSHNFQTVPTSTSSSHALELQYSMSMKPNYK